MALPFTIESSYICQFDTTQGNTLLNYTSKGTETISFEDLEYMSLPSGLHDLPTESDTVKFQILDSNGKKYLSMCRVYNNSKSVIAMESSTASMNIGIDRTKVKIYSLGIIVSLLKDDDIENLVLYEESIIKQIDSCYKDFSSQTESKQYITTTTDKLLDLLSNDSQLTESNTWREPYQLLKSMDCLIFPLWKQLMLQKKILIINNDNTKISFDELNKLVEYLKNISANINYNSVYNTALSNYESVLNNSKKCYIAYTTDAILKDATQSYDVLLELNKNNNIRLSDSHGTPLHATFVESLRLITQFKDDYSKFDGKSKSQQFIDFFYLLFTFNSIKPGYYKYIDTAVDIPLQAPLERQRFDKWIISLNSGIEQLLKSDSSYNKNTKVLVLKPSDVLTLGFDGFNKNDLEFMKNYIKQGEFSTTISNIDFKNFDFSLFI